MKSKYTYEVEVEITSDNTHAISDSINLANQVKFQVRISKSLDNCRNNVKVVSSKLKSLVNPHFRNITQKESESLNEFVFNELRIN